MEPCHRAEQASKALAQRIGYHRLIEVKTKGQPLLTGLTDAPKENQSQTWGCGECQLRHQEFNLAYVSQLRLGHAAKFTDCPSGTSQIWSTRARHEPHCSKALKRAPCPLLQSATGSRSAISSSSSMAHWQRLPSSPSSERNCQSEGCLSMTHGPCVCACVSSFTSSAWFGQPVWLV
eukprot:1522286-Amphidinium_carterae.1